MSSPTKPSALSEITQSSAQSHIGRASKVPVEDGYRTRDWSLFFFFRIMREIEMKETLNRLAATLDTKPAPREASKTTQFLRAKQGTPLDRVKLDLSYPSVLNGGLVRQAQRPPETQSGSTPQPQTEAAASAESAPADSGISAAVAGPAAAATASDAALRASDAAPRASDAAPRKPADDAPAACFLDWLRVLLDAQGDQLKGRAKKLPELLEAAAVAKGLNPQPRDEYPPDQLKTLIMSKVHEGDLDSVLSLARHLPEIVDLVEENYLTLVSWVRAAMKLRRGESSLHGPLGRMVLYEFLRQGAPLFLKTQPECQVQGISQSAAKPIRPVLRSEASEENRRAFDKSEETVDRTSITMAFSYSGLAALKLDPDTLASFPDPFREGMAARAQRLGDVGPNAPENWEGELGLRTVHGFFTGGSNLDREELDEAFWKELRKEIRLFNDPTIERGTDLRAWIGTLFRLVGLEIVHIELGQDPYGVDQHGKTVRLPHRVEHFGFRDGLSQPFVDLGLGPTLPGGGTADRRGTWTPVAPGEIFLDREDETGQKHVVPVHADLREGSTYLVFRKLEQDVEGFRAFLAQQRPGDPPAQDKLAAQFFGRWPNGTSLVHSPSSERSVKSAESEARLNDFRYAQDDPHGRKCPLGAHVRRANPRDIGGRNDVRHHRILRRGIAYGGPLLPKDAPDDGEKRGILFIAANADIDLQFEVIQSDWLNGGEFLGQAGLGRCPISGANDGSLRSTFLEAGAVAPVTGLPTFVTMRGGDYFFAPGIKALRGIAEGAKFEVGVEKLPYLGRTMDDFETPTLFSKKRLDDYWKHGLSSGRPVRVKARHKDLPPGARAADTVAFVGRHDQVREVLSNDATPDGEEVHFSVEPYCTAGRRITRGEEFLIGLDSVNTESRKRLIASLDSAWNLMSARWTPSESDTPSNGVKRPLDVRQAARGRLDAALRRTAGARRIDLVEDLAAQAAYGVLEKVFGISGPTWLSELAAAIPFARQHVGDLPPDWIAALKGERPADPGLKTMQIWTTFLVADLIGNYQNQQSLQAVSRQAGTEMLNHIDQKLAEVQSRGPISEPANLIEAFLYNAQEMGKMLRKEPPTNAAYNEAANLQGLLAEYLPLKEKASSVYPKDVAIILLEILGSTLAVVPLTFGSVMKTLLDLRIDLSLMLPRLDENLGAKHIIYEAERLNPNSDIRVRRCKAVSANEKLACIEKDDFVAAVIAAANRDSYVFWKPDRFSLGASDKIQDDLGRYVDGDRRHPRDLDNYLLFGVPRSKKYCWGAERVALPILEECIYACGRLGGLRKVAGALGEPQKIGTVTVGLSARFTRILSKDAREEPQE